MDSSKIKFDKSLVVLRGLPGSGKSTLVRILNSNNLFPSFSIDDYFTNQETGKYEFNFSNNHLAYKQCLQNVENEMQKSTEKIFVHNTLTLEWELKEYLQLCTKYNYAIFVVTCEKYHEGKNMHQVSDEQLKKMAEKYKVKLL